MLITSQAPGGQAEAHSARERATCLQRYRVAHYRTVHFLSNTSGWPAGVDLSAEDAQRIIVSPFVSRTTDSVLSGCRLIGA